MRGDRRPRIDSSPNAVYTLAMTPKASGSFTGHWNADSRVRKTLDSEHLFTYTLNIQPTHR